MQQIRILFILISINTTIIAQDISGYVIDSVNGEALIGAHIITKSNTSATVTNNYGFFSIKTMPSDTLKISYVGFIPINVPINAKFDSIYCFKISPNNNNIDEVTIIAEQNIQQRQETGTISLPVKTIKELPALGGETDLMKTLQLMPGIRSAGEGQSAFFVRGGSPDQNLIVYDNVPLYYVNHLGGFVSVFNTDAINHVKMYKGGFPSVYGGRLSSITDIQSKDGNYINHSQKLTLGLLSSKLLLEGPVKNDKLTYMISGRRMMYDLFTRTFTYLTENKNQSGYTFYDLNAKINYKANSKNRLFLSLYTGQDKMLSKRNDKIENSSMDNTSKWGNLVSSLRWNHIYGSNLFSNITAYYSQYNYKSYYEYKYSNGNQETTSLSEFQSQINDLSLNTFFQYNCTNWLNLELGTNTIYHTYKPNHYQYTDAETENLPTNAQTENALENAFFSEVELKPLSQLTFSAGYRLNSFSNSDKYYFSHEPRLILKINIPKYFSVKTAYSKMSQFVHLLTYFGTTIPADLWVPSNQDIPPQQAQQISAGIFKYLEKLDLEIGIEAYYKKMEQLIEYKQGYNLFGTNEWENAIEKNGSGYSKGIEFLIQKKTGKLNGWLSYTLAESKRQFDNINNGLPYYYTYDATHDISIVCNYKIKPKLSLSATWTYQTGRAITLANQNYITPYFEFDHTDVRQPLMQMTRIVGSYDEKNNIRMSPYHRLDISLTRTQKKKKSLRELSIGIYNLYNRQNPIYYYTGIKGTTNNNGKQITQKTVYQVSMFPIIPSISYSWLW